MLVSVKGLSKDIITGKNHDDGQVLIYQGQNTMLQLSRHDSLAMEVGNFLDLESTYDKISIAKLDIRVSDFKYLREQ